MTTIIETERLILRTWKKEDAEAYFQTLTKSAGINQQAFLKDI